MQHIIADFGRMQPRPEIAPNGANVIPLGPTERRADIQQIADNEAVILIEPENLQATGYITRRTINGVEYGYGVVTSPLQDIHPEAQAS